MFSDPSRTTSSNDHGFEVDLSTLLQEGSRFYLRTEVTNYRQSPQPASLPIGWCDRACPKCCYKKLVGALISESADNLDPDVLCTHCGYYF